MYILKNLFKFFALQIH